MFVIVSRQICQILFSKQCVAKMVDNCNKVFGLITLYKSLDTTSDLYKKVIKEWKTCKEALLSLVNDRPHQKKFIVEIMKEYIDEYC